MTLQDRILIALLPKCLTISQLTQGQPRESQRDIVCALSDLKNQTLVTMVVLEGTPVWVLTRTGRTVATMRRDGERAKPSQLDLL